MAIKIALDAGHGLNTAGKQTPDGIKEWTLNDKVRDKVVSLLSDYDCEIIHTDNNEGGIDEPLATRLEKYKSEGVAAFVSIHHNAFTSSWNNATGVEVFTDKKATTKDTKLAKCIYNKLVKYTGLKGRGVKKEDWYVINQSVVPAVLVEGGFMDSNIDYKVITSDAGQTAYAKAVAEGLIEFLGLKKKVVASPSTSTTTNFLIKVVNVNKGDVLNIRKEPNANSAVTGKLAYNDPNSYTIIETNNGWGLLKSKVGWINLAYTKTVSGSASVSTVATPTPTPAPAPAPTPAPTPIVKKPDAIYQVYANGKWLSEITNYNTTNSNGYAGIFGKEISGIRVKLSNGKTVTVMSHISGNARNNWLSPVTRWDNTSNGYSGWKGKPTDCIAMKADGHTLKYRVHVKGGDWLGWVSGCNMNDYNNGLAGTYGKPIDAVQIMVV